MDSDSASEMHIRAAKLLDEWQRYADRDTEAEWQLARSRRKLWDLIVVNRRRIETLEQLSSAELTMARAVEFRRRLHRLSLEYDQARARFVDGFVGTLAPSLGFDLRQREKVRRALEPVGDAGALGQGIPELRPARRRRRVRKLEAAG